MISTTLDLAIIYDRLNVKNLVMIEWLCRRLQLQEHAVVQSPEAPSYEGARFWMGYGERRGGALVAPSLQAQVAAEYGKEAAILKEMRKAREAKAAKGRGKGAASPADAK